MGIFSSPDTMTFQKHASQTGGDQYSLFIISNRQV